MTNDWDAISKPVPRRAGADEWDAISRPIPRAPVEVAPMKVDPSEGMGPIDKMLVGAGSAMTRVGHALSQPFVSDATAAERKDERDLYSRNHPGGWATAGEVGADMLMSAIPVAKAGQLGSAAIRGLGARHVAPLMGNIAGNAGYNAATAPDDRMQAGLFGLAGAAGGHALARGLSARAPRVAPGVKELAERDVPLTPGQLYGPGLLRRTEDRMTSVPLVGDLIANARKRSLESYNRAELDDALAPLGRKAQGVGGDAVDAAVRQVESAYDEALERVFMAPQDATSAARAALAEAERSIPMLDPRQLGQLDLYVRKRIEPWAAALGENAAPGKYVKQIDAEIGHYARKYSKSPNPSDHSLGDAFYLLQSQWRNAMQASGQTSSGRDALQLLKGANEAYRNLLPIRLASERTGSGVFTPQGMTSAGKSTKIGSSDLTQAARQVLPTTVPDSGTGGRALQGAAILGGLAVEPVSTLGIAAATAALTSRPALRGMTKAATAMSGKNVYDTLPEEAQRLLDRVDPAIAHRVLAMLGARLAQGQ